VTLPDPGRTVAGPVAPGLVTDSSASLPPDVGQGSAISVVPLRLSLGDGEHRADDVSGDELLQRLDVGEHVTTCAPTPGDFLSAIEAADRGAGVLVITVASSMSSSNASAQLAASHAGARVRVLDSNTAAGGQAQVVLAAAGAVQAGGDLEAAEAAARRCADRVELVAAVGSLDQLVRSGRVPALAGRGGSALGVRPVFKFAEGTASLLMPSFSAAAARERLVARWQRTRPDHEAGLHVCALHADAGDEASWLLDRVRSSVATRTAFVTRFDAAMMVHTGRDVVGLAWWWEADA
jgi:DegV family protein with EDD domain